MKQQNMRLMLGALILTGAALLLTGCPPQTDSGKKKPTVNFPLILQNTPAGSVLKINTAFTKVGLRISSNFTLTKGGDTYTGTIDYKTPPAPAPHQFGINSAQKNGVSHNDLNGDHNITTVNGKETVHLQAGSTDLGTFDVTDLVVNHLKKLK